MSSPSSSPSSPSSSSSSETATLFESKIPPPWTNNKHRPLNWLSWMRGVTFLSYLFVTALLGSYFMIVLTVPLVFFVPRFFRNLNDYLKAWWFHLPVFFCGSFFPSLSLDLSVYFFFFFFFI